MTPFYSANSTFDLNAFTGIDDNVFNKVVWVTNQVANIKCALRPYRRFDCQDHIYNTILKHALDNTELSDVSPDIGETLVAAKALVKYIRKSGLASQLKRRLKQARFRIVFLTLESIKEIYVELKEKLGICRKKLMD